MQHILGIKAVIAQFVEQYLISGEVGHLRPGVANLFHGQQKCGLGYLVFVKSIFRISVWTYGEGDAQMWIPAEQFVRHGQECVCTFLHGKRTFCKYICGHLVTVGHHAIVLLEPIADVGSQGDE